MTAEGPKNVEAAEDDFPVNFARIIVQPAARFVEIFVTKDRDGEEGGETREYDLGDSEFDHDLEKIQWMAKDSSHKLRADPSGGKLNLRKT